MKKFKLAAIVGVISILACSLCGCTDITIKGSNGKIFDGLGIGSGYTYDDNYDFSVGDCEIDETVKSLEINWIAGDVVIAYHDSDKVTLSETGNIVDDEEKMRCRVQDSKLYVYFCKSGYMTMNLSKKLTLTLPKDISFDDVSIDCVSSGVEFDDITANKVNINTVSGSISGQNLIANNDINIDTVSGNTQITGELKAQTYNSDSTSGEVTIDNLTIGKSVSVDTVSGGLTASLSNMCDIDFNSTSGEINLTLPEDASAYIKYGTVSGDANIAYEVVIKDEDYIIGSGDYKIDVDTVSGDLNINK